MSLAKARVIESEKPDKVRMLVLEIDDPHDDTQKENGSFGEILNELLVRTGKEQDPKLAIETVMQYAVEPRGDKVPEPSEITEEIHAILITGSVYDEHSNDEWVLKLVKLIEHLWIHRPDIQFTGIPIELSDIGHWLFRLPPSRKHIRLHQMHQDYVVDAPSPSKTSLLDRDTEVHVWGKSDHTSVQRVYIPKRLFTTQGHMEFDEDMVKRQLEMRVKSGSVEQEETEEAEERASWMHDGILVAKAVVRFFHGDDD